MTSRITKKAEQKLFKTEEFVLMCPSADEALWSMHPRVYLVPDEQGQARCPYCGALHDRK